MSLAEQDADMIAFIHREDMYDTENEEIRGKAEHRRGKHRAGATGSVPLTFVRQYTKFENYVPEPEDEFGA